MAVRHILAAVSSLSLIACSDKAPASATSSAAHNDGSTSPRPPIHIDQTGVLTVEGQPQEEQSYGILLENCRKGGIAAHALSASEVAKIGRVHLEAWIAPDKQSRREEQWHVDASKPCEFTLIHQDQTQIVDANGRSTSIDGVTHQVDVQELGKPNPVVALPASDGELTEGDRQAGWSKQGTATANEAQCAVWQDPSGLQVCIWTGGRQWGYTSDGMTELHNGVSPGDAIVLWAHPGKGSSWKLETREFSVGKALDRRAFAIPEHTTNGTSP
jgi:hypothetical protein